MVIAPSKSNVPLASAKVFANVELLMTMVLPLKYTAPDPAFYTQTNNKQHKVRDKLQINEFTKEFHERLTPPLFVLNRLLLILALMGSAELPTLPIMTGLTPLAPPVPISSNTHPSTVTTESLLGITATATAKFTNVVSVRVNSTEFVRLNRMPNACAGLDDCRTGNRF